jgi:hypothetical protein
MNWTEILRQAGIPESPGRPQAVAAALARTAERKAAASKPKTPKHPGRQS